MPELLLMFICEVPAFNVKFVETLKFTLPVKLNVLEPREIVREEVVVETSPPAVTL